MNPFEQKSKCPDKYFCDWDCLASKSYCKTDVEPFTKLRIILMNGTEFEQNWFMHQLSRHCLDNNIRREVALMRRVEQQQQKRIASLKPIDESILETTIAYEQLAVELTAILAEREPDINVKKALDFALLEDFDHLYRYSNLLEMEHGIKAEKLVGKLTEIMPARPTIAEHRYPYDDIKYYIDNKTANPLSKLAVNIITAAEQQTMNYYMNIGSFYTSDIGRNLYTEIGMIEEQHVSQYGSLIDTKCSWLEGLLMHEYTECYLYYSCMTDETDPYIKKIWESHFEMEVAHLHKASELLKKYDKKDWNEVIPDGNFPELLCFKPNIDYVRSVIKGTVTITAKKEGYEQVSKLPDNYDYFNYQNIVNKKVDSVASHAVIDQYIEKNGSDYRFETKPYPVKELASRTKDNTDFARKK